MNYSDKGASPKQLMSQADTPKMTGAIVIGAVVLLWAIRRGFRGVRLSVK